MNGERESLVVIRDHDVSGGASDYGRTRKQRPLEFAALPEIHASSK